MASRFAPFTLTLAALLTACAATSPTPTLTPSSGAASHEPTAGQTGSPGPSVPALATPFVVGSAAVVSGSDSCESVGAGTVTTDERGEHGRDIPMLCADTANDPRVGGREELTFNYDSLGDSAGALATEWGTGRLENEGGAWEGRWTGVLFPGLRDEITLWYVGSGGYQGLIYFAHISGSTGAYTVEGLIFEGSLPPGS